MTTEPIKPRRLIQIHVVTPHIVLTSSGGFMSGLLSEPLFLHNRLPSFPLPSNTAINFQVDRRYSFDAKVVATLSELRN